MSILIHEKIPLFAETDVLVPGAGSVGFCPALACARRPHFVTERLDEGPIIEQQVIPVHHTHAPQDQAQAGRDAEQMVLSRALRLLLEDRVFPCGKRTAIFN